MLRSTDVGDAQYVAVRCKGASGGGGPLPHRPDASPMSISPTTTIDLSILAWAPGTMDSGSRAAPLRVLSSSERLHPHLNDSSASSRASVSPTRGTCLALRLVLTDITPALYGNWSFYFSRPFRLYVGLGLGYNVGIARTAPPGYVGEIATATSTGTWRSPQLKFTNAIAFRASSFAGRKGRASRFISSRAATAESGRLEPIQSHHLGVVVDAGFRRGFQQRCNHRLRDLIT